jgi:hypothetical protein
MEDITEDRRTALLDKTIFINDRYKIGEHVYMARNDVFFRMAKIFNTFKTRIDAMLIREGENSIVIVPTKSYVFWNGKCVQPEPFNILQSDESIQRLATAHA